MVQYFFFNFSLIFDENLATTPQTSNLKIKQMQTPLIPTQKGWHYMHNCLFEIGNVLKRTDASRQHGRS